MSKLMVKKFSSPDERRPFVSHGHADILRFDEDVIGLAVFEPGWKWSKDVQPLAGTQSCMSAHLCYCLSGRMTVVMDDGVRAEVGPGEMVAIPAGHDAWVVGNEPCVMLDVAGMGDYAQAHAPARQSAPEQGVPRMH
ncbi:cupin domain-containing protein [Hyalangium versicolor]|uniref:cupin domain-containing protein n=1 Tax=Hyalangium versicolor TaxID=2861190 RepID=UPI001CCD6EC5|nr:cupin domain-containing protein [Hyalangium versicolor]